MRSKKGVSADTGTRGVTPCCLTLVTVSAWATFGASPTSVTEMAEVTENNL